MVKNKFLIFVACSALMLSACTNRGDSKTSPIDAPDLVVKKVVDFAQEENEEFFASDGFGNGTPFNVEWNSANAVVENEELHLKLTDNQDVQIEGQNYPYYGGEYRSRSFYGYGDFGVMMKPSKTYGTASTFFLYTGEWDSEELHPSQSEGDTKNPGNVEGIHDEIDIEFLGKDTTKVQFNYFTNGKGGHEYMYNLGFDASAEYHSYGFRFEEDRITWFVDNKPVYTVTEDIPTHPGRIITNYWCGDARAENWMGKYTSQNADDVTYRWISATAEGNQTHYEGPGDETNPVEINWEDYPSEKINVQTKDTVYTVSPANEGKSLDISYENLAGQGYQNVTLKLPSAKNDARSLSFEVTNLGEESVTLRADVNAATSHGDNNITSVNTDAYIDGKKVSTDLNWGGSVFNLATNQEKASLCEINFDDEAVSLTMMIDSSIYQDTNVHTGHIVISNLKIASENTSEPETPDVTDDDTGPVDIEVSETNSYFVSVSEDSKSANITYDGIESNTYKNITFVVDSKYSEARRLQFEIKNNGQQTVKAKVDAIAEETHGEHDIKAVNSSATKDGIGIFTDLEWGGSIFELAPDEESKIVVEYSDTIVGIVLFLDSLDEKPAAKHSGSVTFANLSFSKFNSGDNTEVVPTSLVLYFNSGNINGNPYTITTGDDSTTVTYDSVTRNTYLNISASIESYMKEGYTAITMQIENKADHNVCFEFLVGTYSAESKIVNDGTYDYFDVESGRAQFQVGANKTRDIKISFDGSNPSLIQNLQIYINSTWAQNNDVYTNGNIVFSAVTLM